MIKNFSIFLPFFLLELSNQLRHFIVKTLKKFPNQNIYMLP